MRSGMVELLPGVLFSTCLSGPWFPHVGPALDLVETFRAVHVPCTGTVATPSLVSPRILTAAGDTPALSIYRPTLDERVQNRVSKESPLA